MRSAVVKVGHPDPSEAQKRGITTPAVVVRELPPEQVAKREQDAVRAAAEERADIARRKDLAGRRDRIADDWWAFNAAGTVEEVREAGARLLGYLLLRAGAEI